MSTERTEDMQKLEPLTVRDRVEMFLYAEIGIGIGAGIGYLVSQNIFMRVGSLSIFVGLSIFALLAAVFSE